MTAPIYLNLRPNVDALFQRTKGFVFRFVFREPKGFYGFEEEFL